jgi:hypothetical protein
VLPPPPDDPLCSCSGNGDSRLEPLWLPCWLGLDGEDEPELPPELGDEGEDEGEEDGDDGPPGIEV